MNKKRAARTQHKLCTARTGETEDQTRREVRDDLPGAQADAVAEISAARAAWLEMIRALARAAAQADHDAATRTTGRPVLRND